MKNCDICGTPGLQSTLKEGLKVNIYVEKDDRNFIEEGEAVLVRRLDSWVKQEPFPLHMKCEGCGQQVNLIKEKWLVEFTDPFAKGKTFPRWVIKFHSYGDIPIKELNAHPLMEFVEPYCIDYLNDETLCTQLGKELLGKRHRTILLDEFLKYMKS